MKRLVFAVVSGSMGALVGLLVAFLSGSSYAVVACAIAGAALSLLVRG